MLTFDEIREIIHMVNQSSIQHFELDHKKTKIVISKVESKGMKDKEEPAAAKREPVIENLVTDHKEEKLHTIVSPTVGTFYSAPEPGADPFIKIGEQIQSNTIVCILEAMKLFNEVEAGVNGEVVEILVKDGDFIEYGHPLFLIRPE